MILFGRANEQSIEAKQVHDFLVPNGVDGFEWQRSCSYQAPYSVTGND